MGLIFTPIYDLIESGVSTKWLSAGLQLGASIVIISLMLGLMRAAAVKAWGYASQLPARSHTVDRDRKHAEQLGLDTSDVNWRKTFPLNLFAPESRTPRNAFHYLRARRLIAFTKVESLRRLAGAEHLIDVSFERLLSTLLTLARPRYSATLSLLPLYAYAWDRSPRADWDKFITFVSGLVEQKAFLPLSLALVGLVVVASPSPLLDRIRARDEAAKETNKLLTELNGLLGEFRMAYADWVDIMESSRHEYFRRLASDSTQSTWTWTPHDGPNQKHFWPNQINDRLGGAAARRLEAAGTRVTEHMETIRDKGLSPVAHRILSPVWSSFRMSTLDNPMSHWTREIGMHYPLQPDNISRELKEKVIRLSRQVELTETESSVATALKLDWELTRTMYHFDDRLRDAYLLQKRLDRVATFLNKRLYGTTWSRLLSVAKS
ncbi:hypothetical protein [Streptomyces sp. NBC_01481]|uniref:hypothetical protein n=1 Tax=Streptomyces sp. NBC_01481 TaxID=2975869 RepID=UPI00225075CF|nr:hypothetical protein [Streptomyces sp. NBC_01481]MCX4587025.1 hypothetical protein [Streptomyces sp. NBC_01481]